MFRDPARSSCVPTPRRNRALVLSLTALTRLCLWRFQCAGTTACRGPSTALLSSDKLSSGTLLRPNTRTPLVDPGPHRPGQGGTPRKSPGYHRPSGLSWMALPLSAWSSSWPSRPGPGCACLSGIPHFGHTPATEAGLKTSRRKSENEPRAPTALGPCLPGSLSDLPGSPPVTTAPRLRAPPGHNAPSLRDSSALCGPTPP